MSSVTDRLEVWPPEGCVLLTSFQVVGMPRPAGSKDPVPITRFDKERGHRVPVCKTSAKGDLIPVINVKDSSGENGKNWRTDIRAAASRALDVAHELADGPLAVRATFTYPGPKSRYGTGRNEGVLKDNAARYPHAGELADGSKLARALEDALTSIVWTDDRRVCELWWSRAFGDPGACVDIYTLPATVGPAAPAEQESLLDPDSSGIIPGDGEREPHRAVAG